MDSTHRIPQLSITPTVGRQTPHDEFGAVMARSVGTGVRAAGGVLSIAVSGQGGSVLAGLQEVIAGATAAATGAPPHAGSAPSGGAHSSGPVPGHSHGASAVGGGPAGIPGATTGTPGAQGSGASGSPAMDLLEAQRAMQQEGYQFQAQYLRLQDEMQRESREFNAVTNIMKVRHDSAKAAINNIR